MNPVSPYDIQVPVFRKVIEWLPEAVAVEDLQQRILLVNESFCKLTGYTDSEWQAIGKIDIIAPGDFRNSFSEKMAQLGTEDNFDFEVVALRKDQSYFNALVKVSPLRDDDDNVIGRIILLSDISLQRKQLNAVLESDERLRFLMESTSEGIIIHENGVIIDVNDAVLRMSGFTYDEMIGKSVFKFASGAEHESMREMLKQQLMFQGVREVIDKEGKIRYVDVESKVVEFKGRDLRVITLRDITELYEKNIQEQRLIAIMEASPMFVAIMDSKGLRYMNLPGRKMLGYSADDDISKLKVKDLMSSSSTEIILK